VLENFGLRPGEDIASLYEQYLDARQKLLETILHPETAEIVSFDAPALQRRNSQKENEPRVPSEALLPYITRLVALRQQEQQLQQQSSHVRRQMSAAEDETKDVLARLVDESHLVAPSLNQRNASGQDWLKAAVNDASATKSSALEKLAVGQASVKSAKAALAGITGLPESLDALA
jgi:flagellar motility protein MotE (MotC chaperone)